MHLKKFKKRRDYFMAENEMKTKAYACTLFDKSELEKSSSGGAFTAFSDVILNENGAIACSIYDYESHKFSFELVESKECRDQARGSKYFQSYTENIYRRCLEWLATHPNKRLLFIGTGCQAVGFRRYVIHAKPQSLNRIVFADLICHGVPSQKMWIEYASVLEKKKKGKIRFLTFKDKRNGWEKPTAYVDINGEEISIKPYVKTFNAHCMIRECCHFCPYAFIERETDITIGDYWGVDVKHPELADAKGVSLVLVHSQTGIQLLADTRASMNQFEIPINDCLQPRLQGPTAIASFRGRFWKEYRERGIGFVIKKYGEDNLFMRIKNKMKNLSWGG